MQKIKVLQTWSIRTSRKLYGSVPILRKKAQQRTQELKLFKRNVDDIVCNVKVHPQKFKSTLSLRNLYKKPLHKKPIYSSGTRREWEPGQRK